MWAESLIEDRTCTMAGRDILIIDADAPIRSIYPQSTSGLRGCMGSHQYLGLAVASSGAVHVSAYLVIAILLGSSLPGLIAPKSGRNSIELTLSLPAVETDPVESYEPLLSIEMMQLDGTLENSAACAAYGPEASRWTQRQASRLRRLVPPQVCSPHDGPAVTPTRRS